ncbi:hypothetical protein VTP01DRAFT_10205 [Rhizomucor pusillus]|uniref:uncharacterized protein n=1 Tax=Rhizomucor pusillus TaxID=4840 RepID=UPI003742ADA7
MDTVSLEGSTHVVVDFFEYCVNSILYQRGIYPKEDFSVKNKFGIPLFVTHNPELKAYINQIIEQVRVWLRTNKLSKLVLVIKQKDTGETLERWMFDIQVDKTAQEPSQMNERQAEEQDESNILSQDTKRQIRAIMRQISASVTFLPDLEDQDCTFNVLVHTDKDVEFPSTWGDSDPHLIRGGGEHMRLKSFATSAHKVTTIIAYKRDEEDF